MRSADLPCPRTYSGRFLAETALAAAVFLACGLLLTQVGLLAVAELALHDAAQQAAAEAVLPDATLASVAAAAERSLAGWWFAAEVDLPAVGVNGRPSGMGIGPRTGDHVSVSVSLRAERALPGWFEPWCLAQVERTLTARVERRMP